MGGQYGGKGRETDWWRVCAGSEAVFLSLISYGGPAGSGRAWPDPEEHERRVQRVVSALRA